MKQTFLAAAILAMLAILSCNGSGGSTSATDSTKTSSVDSAKADSTAKAKVPEFKPFDVAEIKHAVKSYEKWKPGFDTDSTARKASGLELLVIGRAIDNPNNLLVVLQASDVAKAKAFAKDPRLKQVMQKNGVSSKAEVNYYHVVRFNPNSNEKQWVVINHKVKDFDAWLKVFDSEGTDKRATFGLVDVALARDIDDSSMVHIVFDIKDMAKAKARINDPELKKLMMDGGVIGAPKIEFYTSAQ